MTHPADRANAEIIANAVRFDVALFIGRGKYAHASARTLNEARNVAAPALEAEHPYGRRALIYAIDANGRSALVTNDYNPPHKHDDPGGVPEFLCRRCHPELNLTPERRRELDAADEERQKKERARLALQHEIHKTKLRLATALKRGEPEEGSVQAKIILALRNKLARLQRSTAQPEEQTAMKMTNTRRKAKTKKRTKAKADPRDAKLVPDPSREPRPPSKRSQAEADARAGKLPEPPDFSAETHKRFRAKLARLVELAKAGDIEGLKAIKINPVSTSPKAMARYRDLCIIALEARS